MEVEGNDTEFGACEDSDVQFDCLRLSPLSTLNTLSLALVYPLSFTLMAKQP